MRRSSSKSVDHWNPEKPRQTEAPNEKRKIKALPKVMRKGSAFRGSYEFYTIDEKGVIVYLDDGNTMDLNEIALDFILTLDGSPTRDFEGVITHLMKRTGMLDEELDKIGNLKVTLTWSMSDEQYDSWVNTLNDYDSFESQPEKFYKPYDDNNVGMVEEVAIERVFAIDRSIVNFDFGNESNEVLSSFSVRIPDTWWDSSDSDDGTIYLRKDERFEIDVPAMELMTSIKVDKTYTMDFLSMP